jgi:Resolvase, N terminal domain
MLIGYAHVSTEDQTLDLQLDALQAAGCERIFRALASGAKAERSELSRALDHVRKCHSFPPITACVTPCNTRQSRPDPRLDAACYASMTGGRQPFTGCAARAHTPTTVVTVFIEAIDSVASRCNRSICSNMGSVAPGGRPMIAPNRQTRGSVHTVTT